MEMVTVALSYHVWVVGGLVTGIVAMAIYIARQHGKIEKITKENTIVLTRNNLVIENNTKAHEQVFAYLVNGKKK